VARGHYTRSAAVNTLFRDMLLTAAHWSEDTDALRISLSDRPKAEAAYGLVVDFPLNVTQTNSSDIFDWVVAGERFRNPGGKLTETSPYTREDLSGGVEIQELESLGSMIDVYNKCAHASSWNMEPIADRKGTLRAAKDHLTQWLEGQRQREPRKMELEPLFIVGLRDVLARFLEEGELGHHA
jgi:hypothetical protein